MHLVSPSGNDVDLAATQLRPDLGFYPVSLSWSPSGDRIAVTGGNLGGSTGNCFTLIMWPSGGRTAAFVEDSGGFRSWQDSGHYVSVQSTSTLQVHDADSGNVVKTVNMQMWPILWFYYLSPLPPQCDGHYVAAYCKPNDVLFTYISVLNKDFRPKRLIWQADRPQAFYAPRVDPTGEWVAWTDLTTYQHRVAFKSLADPSGITPSFIEDKRTVFCDWTEDGNLLVNAAVTPEPIDGTNFGKWELQVYNRRGQYVKSVPTAIPPQPAGPAVWRRSWHY